MNKELQVENGNYTRIVNPLIEYLIQMPFKGCELAVAMFIIRKTYGYQKKSDEISLTQFQQGTARSRQTIVTALKNLEKLNIVVKTGRPLHTNTYEINKYFEQWKLVNTGRLVKRTNGLVKTGRPELVKTGRHTKEKRNIQKKLATQGVADSGSKFTELGAEVVKRFESVDLKNKGYYGNKTQRAAADFLVREYGFEEVIKRISVLSKTNKIPYFPSITTPVQLRDKWVQLQDSVDRKRNEQITKGRGLA